jgi:hypothetical protein
MGQACSADLPDGLSGIFLRGGVDGEATGNVEVICPSGSNYSHPTRSPLHFRRSMRGAASVGAAQGAHAHAAAATTHAQEGSADWSAPVFRPRLQIMTGEAPVRFSLRGDAAPTQQPTQINRIGSSARQPNRNLKLCADFLGGC